MNFEIFLAKRYLTSKRKTAFASAITYMSIGGIAIGVAALIIVLSIMNGFEREVRARLIGFSAHIELRTYHNKGLENYREVTQKIAGVQHIVGISPYITEKALIISKKKKQGVAVKAIDPATVDQVSEIRRNLTLGKIAFEKTPYDEKRSYPGIVLGIHLASKMNVTIGDRVQLLTPAGITGTASALSSVPMWTYLVTGIVETGIFEFDDIFSYISIEEGQRIFKLGDKVSGLEVKLNDPDKSAEVAAACEKILGYPFTAITWFEMNRNLFSWMEIQKWGMFVILSLIVLVAAFNIVSTLVMIVLEKTKDIGVLKSMGSSAKKISRIFIMEGLICGVIGSGLGSFLGFMICWLQQRYQLLSLPPDVYIISAVPVVLDKNDFLFVSAVAIILCYFAALYPAKHASKLDPIEIMRYG